MSAITNPLERVARVVEDLAPLARRRLPEAQERLQELRARLLDHRVSVMVFGAYNAGKSSLINALLGAEAARVGDVPTTDSVDGYDWAGHLLLDTPGVNAPIAHEQVSAEALHRADLVLFVLRAGDQDAQDVYDRLLNLVQAGRHVFVLLNHDADSLEAAEPLRLRLIHVLLKQIRRRHLPEEAIHAIPVLPLNVDLALRGRLQNKGLLLRESGYDEFVGRFNQWLARFEGEDSHLDLARRLVERQAIAPLRAVLGDADSGESELDRVNAALAHLDRERADLLGRMSLKMRSLISRERGHVGDMLNGNPDAMRSGLQDLANDLGGELCDWLNAEQIAVQGLAAPSVDFAVGPRMERLNFESIFGQAVGDEFISKAFSAARGVNAGHISRILHWGRAMRIPLLKGRWSSTLSRWAGRAAPVIQLATGAAEVAMAGLKQDAENAQARDAAIQRGQWIDEISGEVERALVRAAAEAIDVSVKAQRAPHEAKREELLRGADELARDRTELERHAAALSGLSLVS